MQFAVSLMLVNLQYGMSRKRKKAFTNLYKASWENAGIVPIVLDWNYGKDRKVAKFVDLWENELLIGWKPKKFTLPRVRKMLCPSQLVLAGRFKRQYGVKNIKLSGKVWSTNAEEFLKYQLKCYIGKGLCGKAGFQHCWDWLVFDWGDIDKWTDVMCNKWHFSWWKCCDQGFAGT